MFAPLRAIKSSVDQAVIDLVEGVSIWGVPNLEMDLFVQEVRTFGRHLLVCGKVDQSEASFICTLMADERFPGQLRLLLSCIS
jgi:hypothetical protein